MTTSGAVTVYQDSSAIGYGAIVVGPDHNLWFTEPNSDQIGMITTSGVITQYPIPSGNSPVGLTVGPDGNLWFTEPSANQIGMITTSGVVTEFPGPNAGGSPYWITSGPDGNLWFTDAGANDIVRINLSGAVAPVVTTSPQDQSVTALSTASFTAAATGTPPPTVQWQVSTDGVSTFSDIPGATEPSLSFTADGSDNGNEYQAVFTNSAGSATTTAAMLSVSLIPQSISFTAPAAGVVGGSTALTATGGGSGNPVVFTLDASSGAGVCSLSGDTVQYAAPGNCMIDATQAGDSDYATAPPVSQTITVNSQLAVTTATLSAGLIGTGYNQTLAAAAGVTPYSWSLTSGTLPAGLSLSTGGVISGTPTAAGTFSFTVTVTDSETPAVSASQALTITIDQPPGFTSPASATFTVGTAGSQTVTAYGFPVPALTEAGPLPFGLTFTDNGNGTATLAGTPTADIGGTYPITITAANGVGADAVQDFTLTVAAAPTITSADSATFTAGRAGSFAVATSGYPAPALTESGALPAGVTFADNGNGTGTLAGTPAAGTGGTYLITITAANAVGSYTQELTLTVAAAPTITSADSATFAAGKAGSFAVTTSGYPAPALTAAGALPTGVTFVDNGNGTGTLAGTPAPGTGGAYPITITAANTAGSYTQELTLYVTAVPLITSAGSAVFAAGGAGSFTVTSTGYPTPVLTEAGPLPAGVAFADNGNGTATLAGTPGAGSEGSYMVTISAANSVSTATEGFVLTVNAGLAITSAVSATATSGTAFSFTVTTTGTPTPTLTHTGPLPAGITFTANSNGTATLAGTPAAAARGTYPITFTAKNSTGTTSHGFLLTVDETPAFSSAAAVTETAGTAFSYTVSTTGYPTATLTTGTLPAGLTFTASGNGTGTLSGSKAVAAGTYSVAVTAASAAGSASQTITLTVKAAGTTETVPAFTSAATAAATSGTLFNFTITTKGSPTGYTTNVTHSGTLPAGISFTNNGNGTATLSGTPTAAAGGSYPITLTAKNTAGTTTQSLAITVTAAPAITTAASATATTGYAFSFSVTATGAPTPPMTETGALPHGLTWVDNGNGTATLAGTPAAGQGGVYLLTFKATNSLGTAMQTFTLTVQQAPAITSAAAASATHGTAFSFTFTSSGYPLPTLTRSGSVPGLSFTSNSNGTATLSGTPTKAGTYTLTITAKNSIGSAVQTFTLTVS